MCTSQEGEITIDTLVYMSLYNTRERLSLPTAHFGVLDPTEWGNYATGQGVWALPGAAGTTSETRRAGMALFAWRG
jgi:hypothetical protein